MKIQYTQMKLEQILFTIVNLDMLNAEQKFIKKFPDIVAAMCGNNIISPLQYSCNTDSTLFEFWFENYLLPSIPDNSVIVLDNASFHNKSCLSTLISFSNKKIIFLPPYSPDLNPIEKFWANLKSFLRSSLSSSSSLDLALSSFFKVN